MIAATIRHANGEIIRESQHGYPGDTMQSVALNLAAYMLAEEIAEPEDFFIETTGHHGCTGRVF